MPEPQSRWRRSMLLAFLWGLLALAGGCSDGSDFVVAGGGAGPSSSPSPSPGVSPSSSPSPSPGMTFDIRRVSLTSAGAEGDQNCDHPQVSADGRFVVFNSSSSNFPGANGQEQVYLYDTRTGTLELVSVSTDGVTGGNNLSAGPAISGDGRFVAFDSLASDLVPGDTNMAADVFLRDRQTGTTVRCSVSSAGVQGNDFSNSASVSDSGLVAFASTASNLAGPDTNGFGDVFLYDPGTATTTLVSFNAAGTDSGNGASFDPHISADGTTIAFTSDATDLVAGGSPGGFLQIFVRQGGVTRLVSASEAGVAGDADSGNILFGGNSLSSDGRFVVFESDATNLVPGDTNGTDDVFLRDLQAGTLERVSLAWDGQQGNSDSFASTVSADGRFVSFASLATNLVPGGASTVQVYVRDRTTPTTLMLSVNAQGTPGDGGGNVPAISRDGRYVVFRSLSTNLVPNDTNGISDIFEILNPLAP